MTAIACSECTLSEADPVDQPSDNGAGVVSVQTVTGEAVVEQSRRLREHLKSRLEVHVRPCLTVVTTWCG
jgi:hypothetical protein